MYDNFNHFSGHSMNVYAKFIFVVGIAGIILMTSCGGDKSALPDQPQPYPAEFSQLYEELSTNLSKRENELRVDWDVAPMHLSFMLQRFFRQVAITG